MAYNETYTITEVPVTCTGDGSHNWITANFKLVVTPNSSNTTYNVDVYAQIDSSGRMNWNGDSILRVTCNGVSKSSDITLAMYNGSEGDITEWDGPVSFTFGSPSTTSLVFDIDLDLTSTTGTNGNPGITHNSDGGNMTHFYANNFVIVIGDGGVEPIGTEPEMTLTHLSSKCDSLSFRYNSDTPLSSYQYAIKVYDGDLFDLNYTSVDVLGDTSGEFTINNLEPNTTYTIALSGVSDLGINSKSVAYKNITTSDIARITAMPDNLGFGIEFYPTIVNSSGHIASLKIEFIGASKTLHPRNFTVPIDQQGTFFISMDPESSNINKYDQDMLDLIYKLYTNTNSINAKFTLYTSPTKGNWADTSYTVPLNMTGIVKTAHVGVDDDPRRARVWVGVNGVPRPAIVWIGDENGKPRRCI